MNDIEQQRQHFDNIASEFHRAAENGTLPYYVDVMWTTLLKNVTIPVDRSVTFLEAMCGSADTIGVFRRLGFTDINYAAFDYSPSMVAFARGKYPNCRIWEQDITTFCEPNAYDIIVITGGLHHVNKHTKKVLANIYNSLKPNGLFFSCEPTHGNIIFGKIRDYIYAHSSTFDYESEKDYSVDELNLMATESNFVLERQIYPGLLAYAFLLLPFVSFNTGKRFAGGGIFHYCIEKLISIEKYFWGMPIARYFSFVTFGCYRKLDRTT